MERQKQVTTLDAKRSPLAAMAERLSIDASELQSVVMQTVMPHKGLDGNPIQVTNEQFVSFLAVANAYKLDPLKREIFAFPAKGGGIQPVVSIDGWLSIINSRPEFDGMELADNHDDQGNLVSVTCTIHRSDRNHPTIITEKLSECQQGTDPWKQRPARMLRHKATIQCARYAFGLGGIMEEDEAREIGEREINRDAGADKAELKKVVPYPEEDFRANLPKWRTLVEGGRKTPQEIIDTVSTKGALTCEQVAAINDLVPLEINPETGEIEQ